MIDLFLLIGLPGSGKSTYAAAWVAADSRRRAIATDAIRAELFGDTTVQGSWEAVAQQVERQFRQTVQQQLAGKVSAVIYDATNAQPEQRQQMIALARACGFTHITGIWLRTPLPICLQRNAQRDRPVPEAVIRRMDQALGQNPPAIADGLVEVIAIFPYKNGNE